MAIKGIGEVTVVERSLERKIRRLFWLLIAMSLVPGIALVISPARWGLLAPGIQWSAYLFSIILMVVAFSVRRSQVATRAMVPNMSAIAEKATNVRRSRRQLNG